MRLRGEGQVRDGLENAVMAQRDQMFCWVPVCLGIGIGLYFSLGYEPGGVEVVLGVLASLLFLAAARLVSAGFAPLFLAAMLVLTGAGLAKYRVVSVAEPVLSYRYYGPIQGRLIGLDRSSSDAVRMTLDQVVLARMSPERTPARVRVSLHAEQVIERFQPGDTLMMTGFLSPPAGPAEPGGFNFQRHAWFQRLGAVGYTRAPVLRWAEPASITFATRLFSWRMALSEAVQEALPGDAGGVAAAIITGDRSGLRQPVLADLRAANLAHLLAISGLHMGLLTGFVFATVRYGLALVPALALRWPSKKIAAICALIAGLLYLLLSGSNVATERAFIMVTAVLVAVLLDRRAFTLRAVAIAATLVLIRNPEALMGPGFQMSFAATTALVAAFAGLRKLDLSRLPKWSRPIWSVVLSSLVAGLATAPFAAAAFNQIAHYGLIANLLSVPLMGLLVMPAAVLAICLAPFGFWDAGLWVMGQGLRWILFVADEVAGWDGALRFVVAPGTWVVPLLALGLIWAVLIKGRARLAGVAAVGAAFLLWSGATRPQLLIADTGSLMGLQTPQGRVLSRPRGAGFVAGIWLENDGWPVEQVIAADRAGLARGQRWSAADLADWRVMQVSGKTALAALRGCGGADVLILNQADGQRRPCLVYDVSALRETGSLAVDVNPEGDLEIVTAHFIAGARPWNARQGPRGEPIILSRDPIKRAAEATRLSDMRDP
ncbi:ComEC/Rec2 family competence protein [Yoonia sp.]|uniref:ComEC/Rec2 family competence protein n=1 Tax=Yoonia sp. TaxID=2212373 RepID=UPI0035C7DC99